MVQMDESIRKQLEKPQTWFCKYFPKRIQNVGEKEIADRQLVYDFKDGRSHEAVAQMTAARMIEKHGNGCSQLVFIPVPASSVRKNEIRYTLYDTRKREILPRNFITDGTEKEISIPYGLGVNPETKEIFVSDATNYVTPGYLYCFSPEGKLKWKVRTGDIPAHFAFTSADFY